MSDHETEADDAGTDDAETEDKAATNHGQRFDRLPETDDERTVEGRATREAVVDWWVDRFGVSADTFDRFTFWEKGAGKVWIFAGEMPDPVSVESLGMTFLRTRQEHWKPTTDAVQRFGPLATKNVFELTPEQAARFAAGEDQEIPYDGDWGYVIAAHEVAGDTEPIGVGLYVYDELKSMMPKGRQRTV